MRPQLPLIHIAIHIAIHPAAVRRLNMPANDICIYLHPRRAYRATCGGLTSGGL